MRQNLFIFPPFSNILTIKCFYLYQYQKFILTVKQKLLSHKTTSTSTFNYRTFLLPQHKTSHWIPSDNVEICNTLSSPSVLKQTQFVAVSVQTEQNTQLLLFLVFHFIQTRVLQFRHQHLILLWTSALTIETIFCKTAILTSASGFVSNKASLNCQSSNDGCGQLSKIEVETTYLYMFTTH